MIKLKSSVTPNLYWNKINCYNRNMMENYDINKYAFSKYPAGFLLSKTNTQESQELRKYYSNLTQIANFEDFLLVSCSTREAHSYFSKSNCRNCNMMEKMIRLKFTISQKK